MINESESITCSGKYKEAFDDYSKAIEINPEYVMAFNNRAYFYAKSKTQKNRSKD